YYDPCTCSCYQVACPTTSYRLRSQCCPVQSWVQRCYYQPVTTYRQCSYWEPVTSCYAPVNPCLPMSASVPAVSTTTEPPMSAPAGVSEGRSSVAPGVRESTDRSSPGSSGPMYDRYYPPSNSQTMPPASGSSLRPAPQQPPAPVPAQSPPPKVKLEQIVSVPGSAGGTKFTSVTTA